ncbi:hypothetical protein, partial [Pseudomonas syringae group genomosp. 3]|uniref:hypothetical protein n=1 Tax=Pseudomonas syringae group genomosp. 3 TaxID=251701 RepID=UPI001E44A606
NVLQKPRDSNRHANDLAVVRAFVSDELILAWIELNASQRFALRQAYRQLQTIDRRLRLQAPRRAFRFSQIPPHF